MRVVADEIRLGIEGARDAIGIEPDGKGQISDVVAVLNYVFRGGVALGCEAALQWGRGPRRGSPLPQDQGKVA